MKLKLFIIVLLTVIYGCKKLNNDVEIIENLEWEYLTDNQVSEAAMPVNENFENELQETLYSLVKNWYKRNEERDGIYPLMLTIYINENGEVDYLKDERAFILSSIFPKDQKNPKNLEMFYPDKLILKELIPIIEKWNFNPANVVGKDIKYQKTFGAYYQIDSTTNSEFKLLNKKLDFFHDYSKEYFVMVEKMPEPIGGIAAIQSKIKYPEIAKRAGIQGRVYIKAFIDENGDVSRAKILRGIGSGCDEAAIKAVESTKFIPGSQKGKPVKVQVSIPIMFKLN